MQREQANTLLTKYLSNKNLLKHSLAAEAAMKGIYRYLSKQADSYNKLTEEEWGITGLLHDVDYEIAQKENKLDQHGLLIFEKEPDIIPENIAHAIKAHNFEKTKVIPKNNMDWAIACCDQLTGLIVASALIHPEKNLASIDTDFILKRFGEKSFAKGARRDAIQHCEEKLGIPLRTFVQTILVAMQDIHTKLEL